VKKLLYIILIIHAFFFEMQLSHGESYYVSKDTCASDSSDGIFPDCSSGTGHGPFATIQHAADIVSPGDTVFIRQGTYDEKIDINVFGTSGHPITFINFPNETPVIDWSGTVGGYHALIEMRGSPQFITISGLTIQNSEESGILAYGNTQYSCQNITISDVTVLNSGDAAIYFENCSNCSFLNCLTNESGASGVFVSHAMNILIDGNTVINARNTISGHDEFISVANVNQYEVKYNEIYYENITGYFGALGIDAKQGSSNGAIHHNFVHDITKDGGIYIDAYDNSSPGSINNQVFNNKVENCLTGISVGTEEGGTIDGLDIFNNLIIEPKKAGIQLHDAGNNGTAGVRRNVRIYNNTIYSTIGGGWKCGILLNVFTNDTAHLSNVFIENNIVRYHRLQGSSDGYGQICGSPDIINNQIAMNIQVNNNLTTGIYYGTDALVTSSELVSNPFFTDSTNNDFHLQSTSPAIDAGIDPDYSDIAFDYDSVNRPLLSSFDLGAYEFGIYWNGKTNNNWFNASNWSNNQVPVLTDSITIPDSSFFTNYPVINDSTQIKRIYLNGNCQLLITNGAKLIIY